jgi:lysophospholipase L1-like esterase
MVKTITPDDPALAWRGAVSLEHGPGWIQPWRIPYEERELFPQDLTARAILAAGVRVVLVTDSRTFSARLVDPEAHARPCALVCDGREWGSTSPAADGSCGFKDLPAGEKTLELWMPQNARVRLAGIEIDDGASARRAPEPTVRWLTYGSSITHGNEPASPTGNWPARVALTAGVNLTSLGYAGQCHLDHLIAQSMARLPADAISLKIGINIYGRATWSPRTFRPGIIAFVRILRERHPTCPIALVSPIFSPVRETMENKVGFTLQAMRGEVAEAAELLRAHGDRNLHHLDGLALLGPADLARLPDFLHPDAQGHALMAERFLEKLGPVFFRREPQRRTAAAAG